MPWQSRALVMLNPRASSYDSGEAFEHAVRGAASSLRHLYGTGFSPTLWAGEITGTTVTSAESYAAAMEALAVADTKQMLSLPVMVDKLIRRGLAGGALVLVTGPPDDEDLAAFRMLSRDYVRTIVMSVAHEENDAILAMRRAGAVAVTATPGAAWAPAWREAMERAWSTATAG